jgi:transcriptional regulator with XRE-family HTH domain
MSESSLSLDPKILGFWVKCIRETSNWSQEAVAASAGLDVRTIQRIEAGKPISLASRRSLARGLGFDDYDVFQSPKFIDNVQSILASIRKIREDEYYKQFPGCLRIEASRVLHADDLEVVVQATAYSFSADAKISPEAKTTAASMFDYLRDLGDVINDLSYSDKLIYFSELQAMLNELENLETSVFAARRPTSITSNNWADKSPMHIDIGYLVVAPSEADIREMIVSKRIAFGI